MKKIEILPSLLSANFSNIHKQMDKLIDLGIDGFHYDVMDGHFVPNITFGPKILKDLTLKYENIFFDVHLMITNPSDYIEEFIDTGANSITWHIETDSNHLDLIKICKKNKVQAGISLKPETKIETIQPFLKDLDIVLIMSVEPGFGGQKFINKSIEKIKTLKSYIDKNNLKTIIQVDGGVNDTNVDIIKNSGADVLIVGNYLFLDIENSIKKLR